MRDVSNALRILNGLRVLLYMFLWVDDDYYQFGKAIWNYGVGYLV
jgi:hypothetical protein